MKGDIITSSGWSRKFEEIYGSPPTGNELQQFRKTYTKPLPDYYWRDDEEVDDNPDLKVENNS